MTDGDDTLPPTKMRDLIDMQATLARLQIQTQTCLLRALCETHPEPNQLRGAFTRQLADLEENLHALGLSAVAEDTRRTYYGEFLNCIPRQNAESTPEVVANSS